MPDRDDLPPDVADAADKIGAFVRDSLAALPRARPDELWASLLPTLRELCARSSQAEILRSLLAAAVGHADRAALFIVKKGRASGWAAEGFADDPIQEEIREVQVDLEQDTVFREVVRSGRSIAEDDTESSSLSFLRFGQTEPTAAVYVPLQASDRVVGVLYGDVIGRGRRLGRAALEGLALVTSVAVERLLLRAKLVGGVAPGEPQPEPAEEPEPAPRPAAAPPPPSPPEAVAPPPPPADEAPALSFNLPSATALRDDDGGGSVDDDARRFARLLATEIKLYNEQEVAAGRLAGDLYARLREPIESSRSLFHERFDAGSLDHDFFEEQVVEVLAGGDPDLLGPRE